MEEIVIKDQAGRQQFDILVSKDPQSEERLITIEDYDNIISADPVEARQLADAIYKLLGISIDEIKRQAFEAGRDGTIEAPCGYEYPSFDDYQNRGK